MLILIVPLSAQIEKDLSLLDFVEFVSSHNNIIVYIDEDLKKQKVSLFAPKNISNDELIVTFRSTLKNLGYELNKYDNVYYTTRIQKDNNETFFYKLKYNSFSNVALYLKSQKIIYDYIDTTNTIILYAPYSLVVELFGNIEKIDIVKKQAVLKFSILEINDDNLKDVGFQFGTLYHSLDDGLKNVANAFVLPFSSSTPVFPRTTFYGVLKLFNELNFLNVSQNPYMLIQDNKDFSFNAVNTIPFQISKTVTQATNTSEQNSIEYKDVGLKINGKSQIFSDHINLEIDLTVEDILNPSSITPSTYKRQLKSNTNLKIGDVLLLSGIKQTKISTNEVVIPFFSSIPYLGEIFKYKSHSVNKSTVCIAIEVVQPDEFIDGGLLSKSEP